MRALVMFRHPAAVVGSFLRLGWPTGSLVRRLLASAPLMDGPLARMGGAMEEAAGRDGAFPGSVLCACLARALWDFSERNPESMIRASFEELCRDPIGGFRALFERLDLAYDDRVREVHFQLTAGGENGEDGEHGVARASVELTERWRSRVPAEDLKVIRSTWKRLGPPLYQEPVDWPREGERA
jgi:hypothetical protein